MTISVQSNIVNVDAIVTDADGNLVTGLKIQNFRVLDNGQPQQVVNFAPSEAPLTTVMLVEFSARFFEYFAFKDQYWADGFLRALKPQDWVALKSFDLKTTLHVDFTQDKSEVDRAIRDWGYPGFSESNLFDAVYETVDQLRDVKGKKSILVLATGYDTFSKHTLDQILHRLKEADVTIFCVGMGEEIYLYTPNGGGVGYAQAKNQLTSFARMTGGYAYFPRFSGEMGGIFNTIATYLRSQYTLGFAPTTPQDGHYHKLTVQVVDDDGNPLELVNAKGKKKKAQVEFPRRLHRAERRRRQLIAAADPRPNLLRIYSSAPVKPHRRFAFAPERRSRPVISVGSETPKTPSIVGAMSRSDPRDCSVVRPFSDIRRNGTGFVVW